MILTFGAHSDTHTHSFYNNDNNDKRENENIK